MQANPGFCRPHGNHVALGEWDWKVLTAVVMKSALQAAQSSNHNQNAWPGL